MKIRVEQRAWQRIDSIPDGLRCWCLISFADPKVAGAHYHHNFEYDKRRLAVSEDYSTMLE